MSFTKLRQEQPRTVSTYLLESGRNQPHDPSHALWISLLPICAALILYPGPIVHPAILLTVPGIHHLDQHIATAYSSLSPIDEHVDGIRGCCYYDDEHYAMRDEQDAAKLQELLSDRNIQSNPGEEIQHLKAIASHAIATSSRYSQNVHGAFVDGIARMVSD
ncbi:hypothetical protein F4780DRAFT_249705 [Xylariomycetidae sp. FL0641]|nr:hypothetical protein F4780DRAFT_249705 [Xylariomycetidae sp. FL0641]